MIATPDDTLWTEMKILELLPLKIKIIRSDLNPSFYPQVSDPHSKTRKGVPRCYSHQLSALPGLQCT